MTETMNGAPSPSTFEQALSEEANRIRAEGKTGYNWSAVDTLLQARLAEEVGSGLTTRCKQANNSGRAANVLTESMDKDIDLYLVFISAPYTTAKFVKAAKSRLSRFPKLRTIAVAEKVAEFWRVTTILHRRDDDLALRIAGLFPCVTPDSIHAVAAAAADDAAATSHDGQVDLEAIQTAALEAPTDLDGLVDLPHEFVAFAAGQGITLDLATATDALACALGSQFVLFAGPSGTGKSTLARVLAAFLSRDASTGVLEARSGWSGPEDAVGYYSSLTDRFAQTPETPTLLALHEATISFLGAEDADPSNAPSPVLLVEEANLSAIESYLAPLTHGMSNPSAALVTWNIHAQREGANDSDELLEVPPTILLAPWPRTFATINVDANSAAPARKVTARAAVILLEPQDELNPSEEAQRLLSRPSHEAPSARKAVLRLLGDPAAARRALPLADLTTLLERYQELLAVAAGDDPMLVPSKRDIDRASNLMAYYVRLSGWDGIQEETPRIAAEHALLHTLLTQLPPHRFSRAIDNLKRSAGLTSIGNGLGGGLRMRVDRLGQVTAGSLFSDSLDFWAALS